MVCQVHKLVIGFVRIVHRGKPNIAFFVDPDSERIPVSDHDPLPDVKFSIHANKRLLDVFLDYPGMAFSSLNVVDNLVKRCHHLDTSSSRFRSRFDEPHVLHPVEKVLRILLFALLK